MEKEKSLQLINNNKKKLLLPYEPCVGRIFRLLPKLYRPFAVLIGINFCNENLIFKNKIRLIQQFLRTFYKSRWGYLYDFKSVDLESFSFIKEGSLVYICAKTKKSFLRKIFSRLNYELSDYKCLKNRKYVLNFTFLFLDINNKEKNIFIDLLTKVEDIFSFFIILNGLFVEDFENIFFYYQEFIQIKKNIKYKKLSFIEINNLYYCNYIDKYRDKFDNLGIIPVKVIKEKRNSY